MNATFDQATTNRRFGIGRGSLARYGLTAVRIAVAGIFVMAGVGKLMMSGGGPDGGLEPVRGVPAVHRRVRAAGCGRAAASGAAAAAAPADAARGVRAHRDHVRRRHGVADGGYVHRVAVPVAVGVGAAYIAVERGRAATQAPSVRAEQRRRRSEGNQRSATSDGRSTER